MSLKSYTLPNNLKVIEYYIPHVESVAIRVDIRTGSIFETPENAGISHLLEHWVHQGNEKFADFTTFISNLEKLGINQNGVTQKFQSYYYVKTPSDKLTEAFENLFFLVAKPTFPIDRETYVKEVVLNEFYDQFRTPEAKFWKNLFKMRFSDQPLLINQTIGTEQTISNITRAEAIKWYKKYYHAGNMLLTIVGNFDSKKVQKLINSTYKTLPKSDTISFPEIAAGHYSNFSFYNYPEAREQVELVLSFPTFGWKNRLRETKILTLIEIILAGGGYSKLFQALRERNPLVYRVGTTGAGYPSRGTTEIVGLTQRKNLIKVFQTIKDEVEKIKNGDISEEDLTTAKNLSISDRIFGAETPEGIGSHFIGYTFWDEKIKTIEENIDEVKSIKLSEVLELLNERFDFEKVNIGILGKLTLAEKKQIKSIFKK